MTAAAAQMIIIRSRSDISNFLDFRAFFFKIVFGIFRRFFFDRWNFDRIITFWAFYFLTGESLGDSVFIAAVLAGDFYPAGIVNYNADIVAPGTLNSLAFVLVLNAERVTTVCAGKTNHRRDFLLPIFFHSFTLVFL